MAFGTIKPEEVLGMSQDEFKKKLESAVTKEDLDAIKGEIQQGYAAGIDEIKKQLAALTAPKTEPEPEPGDPTTEVLTDPTGFVNKTTRPLQDAVLLNQAAVSEMRARQDPKLRRLFEQHGDEFMKWLDTNKVSIQQRAVPGFFAMAMNTFIGERVTSGDFKPSSYPTLIGTSSVSPNPDDPADPNRGLDPDMAAYYKKRNIPIEKAKEIMDLMNKGEHISMETVRKAANA